MQVDVQPTSPTFIFIITLYLQQQHLRKTPSTEATPRGPTFARVVPMLTSQQHYVIRKRHQDQ